MKNYFTFMFLICFGLIKGQDKIIKTDNSEIEAKVIEITTVDIIYKKFSNPNGPTYNIKKSDVNMVVYKNGDKDVFNSVKPDNKKSEDVTESYVKPSNESIKTYLMQVKMSGTETWGFVNVHGEFVIPAKYNRTYKFSNDGVAPVFEGASKEPSFIDKTGAKIQPEISGFKLLYGMFDKEGDGTGMFPVKKNDKCGFLDSRGKLVVPLKYEDVTEFNEGYASGKIGSSFTVISASGEERPVTAENVVEIRGFSEGLAPYKTTDKRMGFISTDGTVKIRAQYESVGYFKNGLAWAKTEGGKLGYINTKGDWVIQPRFTAGRNFDKESGLARVKEGEKWAYITKTGEVVYLKDTDVWEDFSEGLAEGKKNGKRGFLNGNDQWVIEPQYDGTRAFKNGYAAVKKGEKWGLIDKTGKWVIEPTYDGIKDMEPVK